MSRDISRLVSTWQTGAAFRERVREADGVKTFFCPLTSLDAAPRELSVGELVSVSLRFVDRDTDFHVHGRLVLASAEGFVFSFLPEERDRQELVLASAEGESVPYLRRKAIRTPCNLDARVTRPDGTSYTAIISTISERGAHLEDESLMTGENVQLSITFPGRRGPVEVGGRVTAKVAGPQSGVGIEFIFVASKQRDTVATEVAAFRSTTRS